jgi:hypothetical protein
VAPWREVEREAPELASAVQRAFDAHKHKTMATLRADGGPRISGTEVQFHDGDVWLGSMAGARKAEDLIRDPRVALHSATVDPEMLAGDAKISGRAVEVTDRAAIDGFLGEDAADGGTHDGAHFFRIDVSEISLVRLGDPADHLVVESWGEGRGLRRVEVR